MAAKKKPNRSRHDCCEPTPYVPPEDKKADWNEYEIQECLRTLVKADKIKKNSPLMKAVRAEARKQADVAKATASAV